MTVKNNLEKKICIGVFGCMLSMGIWVPDITHAAEPQKVVAAEDAPSFVERINRIMEEYTNGQNQQNIAGEMPEKTKPVEKEPIEPVKEAPPTPVIQEAKFAGQTYDFDWQGTPLSQTLYAISKISGKRVVINGKLDGTAYTSLHGVTYDQALNYLAKTFNFNWMLDENGDAILISTSDLMLQSKVFVVNHADKAKVKDELKSLGIDEKNLYVNMENGSVSVTGTPYQLTQAATRIKNIDHPVTQCLIVAQLIEVTHGKDLNLGMKYSLPTYSHASGDSLSGNFVDKLVFSASSEANRALSKGRVISRPMSMTLNGQETAVYFGDRVPVLTSTSTNTSTEVTVDYKDIGSSLKVTPVINSSTGEISMNIDMEISNIAKWIQQGSVSAPQISTRKATTSAHLRSGQSFVIGGLMTTSDLDNLSGIPGLMDLPILGRLFSFHSSSKTYSEIFIMVTPYIVTENIDPQRLLKAIDKKEGV